MRMGDGFRWNFGQSLDAEEEQVLVLTSWLGERERGMVRNSRVFHAEALLVGETDDRKETDQDETNPATCPDDLGPSLPRRRLSRSIVVSGNASEDEANDRIQKQEDSPFEDIAKGEIHAAPQIGLDGDVGQEEECKEPDESSPQDSDLDWLLFDA